MNLFVCVCEIRLNHQIFPAVFGVTLSPIKTTYLGGKVTLHPHPANTFWNPRFLSDNNSDLSCFQTNYSPIPFTVWCWSGDQGPHPNCCCRAPPYLTGFVELLLQPGHRHPGRTASTPHKILRESDSTHGRRRLGSRTKQPTPQLRTHQSDSAKIAAWPRAQWSSNGGRPAQPETASK